MKQITFNAGIVGGGWELLLYAAANAHLTLGTFLNDALKTSSSGCMIRSLEQKYAATVLVYIADDGALYSCSFEATDPVNAYHFVTVRNNKRIWNCSFLYAVHPWGCIADFYNVQVMKSAVGVMDSSGTMDKLLLTENGAALYAYGNTVVSCANVTARNNTSLMRPISTTVDAHLINIDTDTWAMDWNGTCTGKVIRQYTFGLRVTDKDNSPLSGAVVTLKDKDGNQVFSAATDANGNIPTQTVTRGVYDQAHLNVLQDSGPHVLTVTKAGYQTYVKKFVLGAKTVWEMKLAKAAGVLFSLGQPLVNLKADDPENQNVLSL
jgi:hypothetical protein